MTTGGAGKADSHAGEVQDEDDCVYRLSIFDALVQGVVEVQGKDGEQGRTKSVRVYVYLLQRQYKSLRCSRVVVRTCLIMPSQHALETFLPGACSRTVKGQLCEEGTREI